MVSCDGRFCNMADFGGVGIVPFMDAVVTAVPIFFPVTLFMIFLVGAGTSYFTILKTTGKKRIWHCLTAMSFVTFLLSLIVAAMNKTGLEYLSGYWVGFYILMTLGSWFLLEVYK